MLSDVDTKRFTLSVVVLFVFTHLFGLLISGPLSPLAAGAPALVVTDSDVLLVVIKELLLSFVIVYLFTRNHEGEGAPEGVRFGIILGLLISVVLLGGFVPVTLTGVLMLVIVTFIYSIIGGIILSLTYKK